MSTTEFRSLFPAVISNSILKDSYLDRVFERFNNLPVNYNSFEGHRIQNETDLWRIEIPFPGATKEDLTISLKESDKLLIEVTGENIWSSGDKREYKLPTAADIDGISAGMKNGLLTIEIPKKKAFQDKLVKIK